MSDFIFKNGNDKILNLNNIIRRNIREVYEKQMLYVKDSTEVIEMFRNLFLDMYENDRLAYEIYMQVMLADTYKMLLQAFRQNTLSMEQLISFNIVNILIGTSQDVIPYIETGAAFFEEVVESSIAFDGLNLLGRKTVVQNSREYDKEIGYRSPLHTLDVLQYGKETTTDEFLEYYVHSLELVVTDPDVLVENIVDHMNHLYIFNPENYLENIKEMCRIFYKCQKFHAIMGEVALDSPTHQYLEYLETHAIEEIEQKFLRDKDFSVKVVDDFCYFKAIDGEKICNRYYTIDEIDDAMSDSLPTSLAPSIQKRNSVPISFTYACVKYLVFLLENF